MVRGKAGEVLQKVAIVHKACRMDEGPHLRDF